MTLKGVLRMGQKYLSLILVLLVPAGSLFGAATVDVKLIDAVKKADVQTVNTLIKQHVNVNTKTPDGTTALHWAVNRDDLTIAKLLIDAGANVKATNDYGMAPLTLACINGSAPMVDLLLKSGADPNTVFSEGETALMTASRTGSLDAVKLLLNAGANPDAKEPNRGQTAIMWAAFEGHAAAIKALIEHEADFRVVEKGGYDAMMYAVREGRNDVVQTLLDAGADANAKTPEGTTLLNLAIFNANYETAATLVRRGADVNALDAQQGPPIVNLIKVRRPGLCQNPCPKGTGTLSSLDLAKLLLDSGAEPNAAPFNGRGAGFEGKGADITAHNGALKAEQAIKADPSVSGDFYKYAGLFGNNGGQNNNGNFQGNYNLSSLAASTQAAIRAANTVGLDDVDAAPPQVSGNDVTPFQLTLQYADVDMAKLLLAHGAVSLGATGNGKTNLMLAAGINVDRGVSPGTNQEAFELVKLMYALGDTEVNAVDDMGSTPLHAAAQRGSKEIIQFLVDKGARLDVSTSFGWTPLDVARGYRDYLGVGRRVMRNVAPQPEVATFVEKLMKDRGLETEHFPTTKQQ
jgi:ankyrin repeat protein